MFFSYDRDDFMTIVSHAKPLLENITTEQATNVSPAVSFLTRFSPLGRVYVTETVIYWPPITNGRKQKTLQCRIFGANQIEDSMIREAAEDLPSLGIARARKG